MCIIGINDFMKLYDAFTKMWKLQIKLGQYWLANSKHTERTLTFSNELKLFLKIEEYFWSLKCFQLNWRCLHCLSQQLPFLFSPFCYNIESIGSKSYLHGSLRTNVLNSRTMYLNISVWAGICLTKLVKKDFTNYYKDYIINNE